MIVVGAVAKAEPSPAGHRRRRLVVRVGTDDGFGHVAPASQERHGHRGAIGGSRTANRVQAIPRPWTDERVRPRASEMAEAGR